MTTVSAGTRQLYYQLVIWLRPGAVDALFTAEGFSPAESYTRTQRMPGPARAERYQVAIDWADPDETLRALHVYQSTIDRHGRVGSWILPAAKVVLRGLERDGHYSHDGTLILFPSRDLRGPLRGKTGWPDVDQELSRLRWGFERASRPADINAVGLDCVRVLGLVADAVYDEERHVPEGREAPGPADAKGKVECFIATVAVGSRFEYVRKVFNAAYAQANAVKHRDHPDRIDAGVAVASTVLVAETLRLLADLDYDRRNSS